jgi:hypothetical protein
MQYVVDLWQVLSRQCHICDWRDRFLNYSPAWAAPLHQRLAIRGSTTVPIQFQRIMSTDVLHEVHPWGPRFPVSGHD